MKPIISVRNISKQYRIGTRRASYATLKETITEALRSPFKRVANWNGRSSGEMVWALKDVNFEVMPGEVVGIIGRNGAGKSTLLKILSRITEPTKGRIELYGRVGSLLEVGTGFHPELTGRENVYLNGAVLGMSRREIDTKFDEIVAFAEIEKFLDTPVKHYSSGMYTRLAFAVAAHLEPEILIVDEVLAVGDAKFQNKCLAKMKDMSGSGRTVIFVSHQMGTIAQLCSQVLFLENGEVIEKGKTQEVITSYIGSLTFSESRIVRSNLIDTEKDIYVAEAEIFSASGVPVSELGHTEPIILKIDSVINKWADDVVLGVIVKDLYSRKIFTTQIKLLSHLVDRNTNQFTTKLKIPAKLLTPGRYSFSMAFHIPNVRIIDQIDEVCRFKIIDMGSEFAMYEGLDYGCVFANCSWEIKPNM